MGSRLWSPGGKTLRRVHGNRAHGEADRDPVHGLLEGGGRQDRGQLRLPRLPPRDGSAGQGCLRRERLGGLRQGRARPSCTEGKIENSNEDIAQYGSLKALFCGVLFLSMTKCIGTKSISTKHHKEREMWALFGPISAILSPIYTHVGVLFTGLNNAMAYQK